MWHRGHILFLLSATQLSYLLMDRVAMIADCRGAGSSPPMLGPYNSREAFTTHSKGLSLDLLAYESLKLFLPDLIQWNSWSGNGQALSPGGTPGRWVL